MPGNFRNKFAKIIEEPDKESMDKEKERKFALLNAAECENDLDNYIQSLTPGGKPYSKKMPPTNHSIKFIPQLTLYNNHNEMNNDSPTSHNYADQDTEMNVFVLDKNEAAILNIGANAILRCNGGDPIGIDALNILTNETYGLVIGNSHGRKMYTKNKLDARLNIISLLPLSFDWKCSFNFPYGFEAAINSKGELYFLDYNTSTTLSSIEFDRNFRSTRYNSHQARMRSSAPTRVCVSVTLNSHLANLQWECIVDQECRIIKSIPPNPNRSFADNTSLVQMFKIGERIVAIDRKNVESIDDVKEGFSGTRPEIMVELIRDFDDEQRIDTIPPLTFGKHYGLKPAILSDSRKVSNRFNKPSVHFAEKPVILEYQREIVKQQTESNTIEMKYDNVIRIKLETGMVKTIKATPNHTVYNVIEKVMGKLHYQHLEIFCLALVDSAHCNVHYFSLHQKMSKIFKFKKNDITLECRILILHPPEDIKSWVSPEWIQCFDYLFFQYRNELLSGNVVKNDVMNEKTLLHLIGFVVATDNMVECLNKLEMYLDPDNTNVTVESVKLNGIGNLVVPSSFLANVDYRIKFLCKSISAASLNEHVLTIFSDLLPQPFFQLIFAEIKQLDDIHFTLSEPVFNEFKYITHNAQLAFLQLAIQFNLVGIHRFRVHVIECPGVKIQETAHNGLPFHFYIDFHSGYGITKDTSNFNMLVGDFYNVLGIYVYSNGDDKRVISLLSKREGALTLIANQRESDNIISLMRSVCSMKSDEYHCESINPYYVLPVIDFTDLTYSVSNANLPKFFNHYHLTIPSFWNHCSSLEEFTNNFWPYFKRFHFDSPRCSSLTPRNNASNTDSDIMSCDGVINSKTDQSEEIVNFEKIPALLPYLVLLRKGYFSDNVTANIVSQKDGKKNCSFSSSDNDEDSESLSTNPWIKKLVNADEVDIRRRNSFTAISVHTGSSYSLDKSSITHLHGTSSDPNIVSLVSSNSNQITRLPGTSPKYHNTRNDCNSSKFLEVQSHPTIYSNSDEYENSNNENASTSIKFADSPNTEDIVCESQTSNPSTPRLSIAAKWFKAVNRLKKGKKTNTTQRKNSKR